MKGTRLALASSLFLLSFMLLAAPVQAVVIHYDAYDLGYIEEGLWQYDFTVSGYAFSKDSGFDIFFDSDHYTLLDGYGLAPPPGWDFEVLYSESYAHAVASYNKPSLEGVFTVAFQWEGTGLPGFQPFELFELNGTEFKVAEWGFTTSAVPEPGTLTLLAMGLLGLAGLGKRELRSHP